MMIEEYCEKTLQRQYISDLHLTVNDYSWRRENGIVMRDEDHGIITESDLRILISRLAPNINGIDEAIRKREEAKDADDQRTGLDIGSSIGGYRVRCNISHANSGQLSVVLRKLNDKIPSFAETTLPITVMEQSMRASGLVLVTGPTGSGKSTTLAAILDEINQKERKHILTIEDPVEYELESKLCKISRKEIGIDGPSFPAVLRAAVRQDPDVIMVGEIRDRETMRIAFAAAETGHTVFATMHTNSTIKTVDRVTSFFPGDEKGWAANILSTTLNCIVSQTLIPKKNGEGRMLGYEIMVNGSDVRNLIADQKASQLGNAIEQGKEKGHISMHRMITELVAKGDIDVDAAVAATYDPDKLREQLRQRGIRA